MPTTLREASLESTRHGLQLYAQGRHVEALHAFDEALALDDTICLTRVGKGKALLELRRPAEAQAAFERALTLDPTNAAALHGKAQAHEASRLEQVRHVANGVGEAVPFVFDGLDSVVQVIGHALVALVTHH